MTTALTHIKGVQLNNLICVLRIYTPPSLDFVSVENISEILFHCVSVA